MINKLKIKFFWLLIIIIKFIYQRGCLHFYLNFRKSEASDIFYFDSIISIIKKYNYQKIKVLVNSHPYFCLINLLIRAI